MKFSYAILATLAFGMVSAQGGGRCNCDPADTQCISACVTGTNDCVTECKNDTACYEQCVQGWPGVGQEPSATNGGGASGGASPSASDDASPSGSDGASQPSESADESGASPAPTSAPSDNASPSEGAGASASGDAEGPESSAEASGEAAENEEGAAGRVQISALGLSAVAVVAALAL
ncbi:hypothetical protein BJV82DRAFT_658729 [Fennellomyces sp. T-0311]|nr:hypothetical protein BJV82DRAFT_658729 [Fennellomyces sp. T-0311]